MSSSLSLLLAVAIVFAVNLLPAFGPPTWAILVFFSIQSDVAPVPLVLLGALAAACGRLLLASGARRARPHLSPARLASIDRAQAAISANRGRSLAALGLFALSPVPSGQLFVGAGLMTVELVPLTAAFFAGRLVSYSIYVGAASVATASLGEIVTDALTSPLGLGLQIAMLIGLALLAGGIRPGGPRRGRSRRARAPSAPAAHR